MSKELKPCPFCGNSNIILTHKGNEHTRTRSVTVKCAKCICKRETGAIKFSLEWCEAEAVTAWNTRPSPWISVEDKPKSGELVYITWKNEHKKRMVVVGYWLGRWQEESDCEDGANDEYSDQEDKYYIKEGWYEQQINWGDWSSICIHDGKPDFYQPITLPEEVTT